MFLRIQSLLIAAISLMSGCKKNETTPCPENPQANCFCTLVYDPVCGCNNKTYSNACFARCDGITDYTPGPCSGQQRLDRQWKVQSLRLLNPDYNKTAEKDFLLDLRTAGRYSITLDVNSCEGTYSAGGGNSLQLGSAGCTKVCCDSDFAMKLTGALGLVRTYSFKDKNTLLLFTAGQDVIELQAR